MNTASTAIGQSAAGAAGAGQPLAGASTAAGQPLAGATTHPAGTPSPTPPPTTRLELSRALLRVARPVLAPLGISVVARLAALLLGIALFGVGGWAVTAAAGGQGTTLGRVAWILVGLALAKGVLRYLEQFSGHYVAFRSLALLRNHFFDRLAPQAPARTEGEDSGDLLSRVTKDIDRIEVFFAHTLAPGITAVLAPLITLVWLGAGVSWWSALGLAPFLLLAGAFVPRLGSRATDAAAQDLRARRGQLAQHVTDSVQGVREVLAFNQQERRLADMGRLEGRIGADLAVHSRWVATRRGLNQALLAGAVLVAAGVAAWQYSAGAMGLGGVGLVIGVALGSFAPVLAVEDFAADLDQAFASARRVFAITDREPLVHDPADPRDSDGCGNLVVDDVTFTYPQAEAVGGPDAAPAGRPPALVDVSLSIPAGRVTAIVGASGSGKSTLAALIERMWDVEGGAIRIGDTDIRDLTQQRLRELVAYAPQRPYVFNDTVRANLLLAAPSAGEADLRRVCEQVGLAEWIAGEPDGLDTRVGEMGERLSGGQRQRLALGRALLRAAPVTILDEATSQLDATTEAGVLAGIRQATAGRTLVVIAHRIATVHDADQIVVIDAGTVAEVGTWEELMEGGGALAALVAREA